MEWLQILQVVGPWLISAIAITTQTITWYRARKKDLIAEEVAEYKAPVERDGLSLENAAKANDLLQKTLQSAYAENERLRERWAEMELQNKQKDEKIRELETKLLVRDHEISIMKIKIEEIEHKLQIVLGGPDVR